MENTLELLEDIKKCMIENRPLDIAMAFRIEACIAKLRALAEPDGPPADPAPTEQLEAAQATSDNGGCEIFVGQSPAPAEHRNVLTETADKLSNVFRRDRGTL